MTSSDPLLPEHLCAYLDEIGTVVPFASSGARAWNGSRLSSLLPVEFLPGTPVQLLIYLCRASTTVSVSLSIRACFGFPSLTIFDTLQ